MEEVVKGPFTSLFTPGVQPNICLTLTRPNVQVFECQRDGCWQNPWLPSRSGVWQVSVYTHVLEGWDKETCLHYLPFHNPGLRSLNLTWVKYMHISLDRGLLTSILRLLPIQQRQNFPGTCLKECGGLQGKLKIDFVGLMTKTSFLANWQDNVFGDH